MTKPMVKVNGVEQEMSDADYAQYLIDGAAQAATVTTAQRADALAQGAAMVARAQVAEGQRLIDAGRTTEGLVTILKSQGVLP